MEDHQLPTCLVGDFNAIIAQSDKYGGSQTLSGNSRSFRSWIDGNGLIDLGFSGPAYTWSNKQPGRANVSQRLDRAFSNLAWTIKYPACAVFNIPRFCSDHSPVLVRMQPMRKKVRPNFRCENWWALKPGFKQVCQRASTVQTQSWREVSTSFRKEVRNWEGNNKSPDTMLHEVEKRMADLESKPPDLINPAEENELQKEHERILMMREFFWHQRARVNWAVHGDRNSKFFHATAVTRKRKNTVRCLQGANGEWITSDKEIRRAFLTHFRSIYKGAAYRPIAGTIPSQVLGLLPKIPQSAHEFLISDPTQQEIKAALFALGANKAPGPDGFNAKIIQEQWDSFGPSILREIQEFFQSGVMKSHVARSNLVLIPKVDEAKSVS